MSQSKTRRPMVVSRLAVRSVATIAALALCGFGVTGVASASTDSPEVSEEPVVTEEVVVPEVIEEPAPVVEEPASSEPISEPEPVVVEQQDVASSDRSEQATTSKSSDKSDKGHKPGKGDKGKPGGHKPPEPEPPVEPEPEPPVEPEEPTVVELPTPICVEGVLQGVPTNGVVYSVVGDNSDTLVANPDGNVKLVDNVDPVWDAEFGAPFFSLYIPNFDCSDEPVEPEEPTVVVPEQPVCNKHGETLLPADTDAVKYELDGDAKLVTATIIKPGFTFDENELNGYEVGYVDDETGVVAVLTFDVSDCKPADNGGGEPNPTNPGGNNGGNQPPANPNLGNNGGNQPPANAGGTPTPVDNSTPAPAPSDDTKKKESLKGGNYVTGVDAPSSASPLFAAAALALLLGLVFAIFAFLPAAMQDRIVRRLGVRMQS